MWMCRPAAAGNRCLFGHGVRNVEKLGGVAGQLPDEIANQS